MNFVVFQSFLNTAVPFPLRFPDGRRFFSGLGRPQTRLVLLVRLLSGHLASPLNYSKGSLRMTNSRSERVEADQLMLFSNEETGRPARANIRLAVLALS